MTPAALEHVRSKTTRIGPGVMVSAVALILGIRFFLFIHRFSVNVLFFDQFDFLGSFFDHTPRLIDLFFLQHGPHREGVGLIADKYLYPLTNWNVRAESAGAPGGWFQKHRVNHRRDVGLQPPVFSKYGGGKSVPGSSRRGTNVTLYHFADTDIFGDVLLRVDN